MDSIEDDVVTAVEHPVDPLLVVVVQTVSVVAVAVVKSFVVAAVVEPRAEASVDFVAFDKFSLSPHAVSASAAVDGFVSDSQSWDDRLVVATADQFSC